MPLRRMLNDNRAFEPKAVALLLEVFDEIVADLDLRIDADREKAAKIVMRLAHGQAEIDAAKRAGSVCLDRFPRTISGVLPGLLSLPHWGWTKGGRSPTGGPTPMRRGKFHAAAAIDVGRK
jgi:hypothetical protein